VSPLCPVGFSRTVAIKRLHTQFAKDSDFVSMFLDEAVPVLERLTRSCRVFDHDLALDATLEASLKYLHDQLLLGQAHEARGDKTGACRAYALVIERWGRARPRSVTAAHAADRIRALGCAPSPPR
jgi:hypothetical protein